MKSGCCIDSCWLVILLLLPSPWFQLLPPAWFCISTHRVLHLYFHVIKCYPIAIQSQKNAVLCKVGHYDFLLLGEKHSLVFSWHSLTTGIFHRVVHSNAATASGHRQAFPPYDSNTAMTPYSSNSMSNSGCSPFGAQPVTSWAVESC